MNTVRYRIPAVLLAWYCLTVSLVRLLRARKLLGQACRILVAHEAGFGETISATDAMRRLFKGEKLIAIFLERENHNPLIGHLWSDIDVLFLPSRVRARLLGWTLEWHAATDTRLRWAARLSRWLRRRLNAHMLTYDELHDQVDALRSARSVAALYASYHIVGRAHLINTVDVPDARLPEDLRREITGAIAESSRDLPTDDGRKLCCLYLRAKGEGSGESTSAHRAGAPFDDYVPAIDLLIQAGFLVLLTGDRTPGPRYEASLDRGLVHAARLNVDPRLYSLFAATESDIWIGNLGGGTVLPATRDVPKLVLDAFPFGAGIPNAMVHFKTVRDLAGNLVHYSRLFSNHAFDWDMNGLTLCDNTADQITAAVEEFLRELRQPAANDFPERVLASLPDHVLTKQVNGRISRSWLHASNPTPKQQGTQRVLRAR